VPFVVKVLFDPGSSGLGLLIKKQQASHQLMRGLRGLGCINKKPLPEKRLALALNSLSSSRRLILPELAPKIGRCPKRLPGFHRAGPSTPLDEPEYFELLNIITIILNWPGFVKKT
jgi:hypothetical protein